MLTVLVIFICFLSVSGQIPASSQCQPSTCGTRPASCSTNSDCQCLALSSGSGGVCAVSLLSCSSLTPCANDNVTCTVPCTVCVVTTQCNQPMCYPLALADPQVCPPVKSTAVPVTSNRPTSAPITSMVSTGKISSAGSVTTAKGSSLTSGSMTTVSVPLVAQCASARCGTYTQCSPADTTCACFATSTGSGICGLGSVLCSSLTPCNNNTLTCNNSQSVCIVNSCCVQPVCFPLSYAGNSVCPTNYTNITVSSSSTPSTSPTASPTTVKINITGPCLSWNQNPIIVAGNGTAGNTTRMLNGPIDLSIDSNFNLYVNDYYNSRIIKFPNGNLVGIPLTSGVGSGLSQVNYPLGSVIDTYGSLYISDTVYNRIMKYANILSVSQSPPITGQIVVSATYGTNYNQQQYPWSVAVDSTGNIFVSDYSLNRVMKWAPSATTATVAAGIGNGTGGNGASQLSCPMGIYVDQSMALYIADACNGRIQKWISGASAGVTVGGGNGQLNFPTDVTVDSYGTIYAWSNGGLYRFYPGSTSGTLVISWYTTSYGFKFDSLGNVYVADFVNNVINKYTVNSTSCGLRMAPLPSVLPKSVSGGSLNDRAILEAAIQEVRRKQQQTQPAGR